MYKRRNLWLIPAVFCCICFLKMLIFSAHNWGLSPENPASFFLLKISAAIFICSFAFFFKNKAWTIPFSFVYDFWIVSNQVYLRSNYLCFDGFSSTLIHNLKGFGGGILGLFEWSDLTYAVISIVYSVVVIIFNGRQRRMKCSLCGVAAILASVLVGWMGMLSLNRNVESQSRCMNPFSSRMHGIFCYINDYCHNVSVSHLLIYDLADVARIHLDSIFEGDNSLSEAEKAVWEEIYKPSLSDSVKPYSDTVVILLIESMESWAVHPEIMPNTCRFLNEEHVLYAPQLKPQIMAGTSSDGQFVINSGLLPLDRGALCFTYPDRNYPSIASNAIGQTAILIPHSDKVWNQKEMSVAEGYDATIQIEEPDDIVFNSTLDAVREGYQVVQSLTMSSHVPFTFGARMSCLQTPSSMPRLMSAYVKSMNYTDENLELIYKETREGGLLHNATVVITGDHTIFYKDIRARYARYCEKENIDCSISKEACPLIIYSPHIDGNVRYDDQCWQMDVFPTVMALLGNPDPTWKGLGMNLLGGEERLVSAGDAMVLGNKIVRNDMFSSEE